MVTKTYLVTGAAGFIGSRFVESCNPSNISLISVDQTRFFKERAEHRGLSFGKIIDFEEIFSWLEGEKPELHAIVHLGACTDTTETDRELLNRLNLSFSQMLWDYATRSRIPLIYASSAATYGNGELGYSDDESQIPRLRPLNAYGESKQSFDLWALAQEKAGSAPPKWCGFKFFNVYGFGERHKGKMASVALHAYDQIKKSGRVKLFRSHRPDFGDGEQKRDFIFVEDVVRVLHFAIDQPIGRGIFNLGTGEARSFLDLVRATFACLGQPEKIEFIDTPAEIRENYQYYTQAEMQKLRAEGYVELFTSLETGVEKYLARL